MKSTTSEALARLVSTFVTAIESTGAILPDDIVQRISENPIKACEWLNDYALSCNALDEQTDLVLADTYESLDAVDARGVADDETRSIVLAAFAQAHREPQPEPEIEVDAPTESAEEAKPQAEEGAEGIGENGEGDSDQKPRGRKRQRRKSRDAEGEPGGDATGIKPGEDAEDASANVAATESEGAERPEGIGEPSEPQPLASEGVTHTGDGTATEAEGEGPAASAEATGKGGNENGGKDALEEEQADNASPEAAVPTPAPTSPADDESLTVDQAAAIMGVNKQKVYKLIDSGSLPAHKRGRSWRISAAAVAAQAAQ